MPVTEDFLKNLPHSPGVYMMLEKRGKVLYVGKASSLRNRVRSYFVRHGDDRPSIPFLMKRVDSIRTILTETEKEALILENNLIKQHRPRFNVNLRDDKSFFSLKLNVSHPFPKLSLVRTQQIKPDGERYFGPYSSSRDARVTLNFILKIFPLRQCTDRQFATCKRPCLNCQMKKCLCPCAGKVDQEEYGRMVKAVTLLLQGKSADLVRDLQEEMKKASQELRFEEAARIRDSIASVNRTLEVQNVAFFHLKDQDVMGLYKGESEDYVVQVISFRMGKLLSEDSFFLGKVDLDTEEVMTSAVKQYYGSGAFVPKEILVSHPIEDPDLIETWLAELRGNKVSIRVPVRGQGSRLMALALKNAHSSYLRRAVPDTAEVSLQKIAERLGLPGPPRLIEGYDISNVAGTEPVGVKIAFKDGKPYKTVYRKYKMKGFSDQDDPGMIHQTMTRRLGRRASDPLPDLFLIDGGKSQLNAAVAALKETLGSEAPPVAAIAKARKEGEIDRIFVPNRKNHMNFPKGDPGLMLLMRVRDESHRFVHTFHSDSRHKAVIRSVLEDVPGIGTKKRDALLTKFGSLRGILNASDEDISQIKGVNGTDIERIREHFKNMEPREKADVLSTEPAEKPPIFDPESLKQ